MVQPGDSAELGRLAARLLERPAEVEYRDSARALIAGRKVLVTGAGGSIGSEIVRQATGLGAERVFMLDHDESSLHALQLEMLGHGLLDDDSTVLADIRERDHLIQVFRTIRPDVVFHAAAHKHLPLLERYPAEAIKTNVLGTRNVVEAAIACGADELVNVSTDKAARPTSVLGASKRLAEGVVRSYTDQSPIRLASVRFGNVLGSRGSFLPTLMSQVKRGLTVTLTDPLVSRFFMTIPEAAGLVIEAATMASVGETYVLDMGEPVRIVDLIERYVSVAGVARPSIEVTGLRPGEKMHEELFDDVEVRDVTAHSRIWAVRPRDAESAACEMAVDELTALLMRAVEPEILRTALMHSVQDDATAELVSA